MAPLRVKQMWEEAMARFEELTGDNLARDSLASPGSLRDAIQVLLDEKENGHNPKIAKAKEMGLDVLACLEKLGGVAAQGASMVFGPADLCFNAISLLLDIPQKIRASHEAVASVFLSVGPVLTQLAIYERIDASRPIHNDLTLSINKVMISFVDICAKCINIKYGDKWYKFKKIAKRALCEDKELEDELANFKSLVGWHNDTQGTLAYELAIDSNTKLTETGARVSNIETGVTALTEAESQRKSEGKRREYLSKIMAAFGISETATTTPRTVCEDIWHKTARGTGQWFKQVEAYQKWADRSCETTSPLLFLTGEPSTGKSYSVSAIIHHLESVNASCASTDRFSISYYFFSALTGKLDDDKQRAETALKWIALRLAEQDIVYAKTLAEFCTESRADEKYFQDASCGSLWTDLKIGSPNRKKTHFILFDGLDNLPESARDQLTKVFRQLLSSSSTQKSLNARVLLCGRPETFDQELYRLAPENTIDIGKYCTEDMQVYISQQLEAAGIFQGQDQRSKDLVDKIGDKLVALPDRSYHRIQTSLRKIEELVVSGGTERELDDTLEGFTQDPRIMLKVELKKLEATLSARQIDELNELLVWVQYGEDCFSAQELQAALFLRFKRERLESLDRYIEKNFSKIFTIGSDGLVRLNDNVEDCVVKERQVPRLNDDAPRITATITITNADITTTQKFLWDLNRYAMLDGFMFRPGDGNGSYSPKGVIRVNRVDAHLSIVKSTLEFLRGEPDSKTAAIGAYMLSTLPAHLKVLLDATGLDEIGSADKQIIGKGIYDLFEDPSVIQKHWPSFHTVTWYRNLSQMSIFLRWLDDKTAVNNLSRRDRVWLKETRSAKSPSCALLTPIMTTLADHWLRQRKLDPMVLCIWIRWFLSLYKRDGAASASEDESKEEGAGGKTGHRTDKVASNHTGADDDDDDEPFAILSTDSAIKQVHKAEIWCQKILGVDDPDSLWFERLGATYDGLEEDSKAVSCFRKATELPGALWRAWGGLATSLCEQDDLQEARHALERAAEVLEGETYPEEEKSQHFMFIANLSLRLRQPTKAFHYSEKALNLNPDNDLARYAVLKHYLSNDRKDDARKVLSDAAEREPSRLGSLIRLIIKEEMHLAHPTVFWSIASISGPRSFLDMLLGDLEEAIRNATIEGRHDELSYLLICKGIAMQHRGEDDLAIGFWEECWSGIRQKVLAGQWELADISMKACQLLSTYHFEMARGAQGAQEQHIIALERILKQQDEVDRGLSAAKCYLACHYRLHDDKEKAKAVFAADMATAFRLLTDSTDMNDWEGYYMLAAIFLCIGDDRNASAAFSLLAPSKLNEEILSELLPANGPQQRDAKDTILRFARTHCYSGGNFYVRTRTLIREAVRLECQARAGRSPAEGEEGAEAALFINAYSQIRSLLEAYLKLRSSSFIYSCDGCDATWDFETAMHGCRFCYDTGFCGPCLEMLKAKEPSAPGAPGLPLCSPKHDWLYLPKWDVKRYAESSRKLVRVGSRVENGVPVDGVLITLPEWLATLRDEWGFSSEEWDFKELAEEPLSSASPL